MDGLDLGRNFYFVVVEQLLRDLYEAGAGVGMAVDVELKRHFLLVGEQKFPAVLLEEVHEVGDAVVRGRWCDQGHIAAGDVADVVRMTDDDAFVLLEPHERQDGGLGGLGLIRWRFDGLLGHRRTSGVVARLATSGDELKLNLGFGCEMHEASLVLVGVFSKKNVAFRYGAFTRKVGFCQPFSQQKTRRWVGFFV